MSICDFHARNADRLARGSDAVLAYGIETTGEECVLNPVPPFCSGTRRARNGPLGGNAPLRRRLETGGNAPSDAL